MRKITSALLASALLIAPLSESAHGQAVNQGAGAPSTPWTVSGKNLAVRGQQITIAASAHANATCLGAQQTLSFFRSGGPNSGTLVSYKLYSTSGNTPTVQAWIFSKTTSLCASDGASFTGPSATDAANLVDTFSLTLAVPGGASGFSFAEPPLALNDFIVNNDATQGTNFYVVLVNASGSSYTPGAANSLYQTALGFE